MVFASQKDGSCRGRQAESPSLFGIFLDLEKKKPHAGSSYEKPLLQARS